MVYSMRKIGFAIIGIFIMSLVFSLVFNGAVYAARVIEGIPKGGATALPPLKGPKKLIAVGSFENKSNWTGQWKLGEGFVEMLTTSLMKTNRFVVLERPEVDKVLEEQDFGASDRTTKEGAAKIGKILRAQILVSGAVTEFETTTKDTGIGVTTRHIGVGGKISSAHVAINLRMYDTTTGEVLFSERVEGKAQRGGIAVDYTNKDFAIGGKHFVKTPLGEATQKVIDNAVFLIASKMQDVQWQGYIVKVSDGKVYINAGKNMNVMKGDTFTVYSKGEELVDPETGMTLGFEEEKIGKITVVKVEDKYAIATVDEGEGMERGDILKYEK